jgi:hypothetical protein
MATDPPTDTPEIRWEILSAALDMFHKAAWNRRIKAQWLAEALARSVTDYIGIPLDRESGVSGLPPIAPIQFYSYKSSVAPEYDTFDLKDNAFDAIGIDAQGFHTFGLGVQLEMQPATMPRYRFHWYVRAKLETDRWTCQVGVGNQKPIELTPSRKIEDLLPIVEAIYVGLRDWLQSTDAAGHGEALALRQIRKTAQSPLSTVVSKTLVDGPGSQAHGAYPQ